MKSRGRSGIFLSVFLLLLSVEPLSAQRMMEKLNRGIIAIPKGNGQIYVGWRLLGNDLPGVSFNLYQSVGGGSFNKVNQTPMRITTDTLLTGCNSATTNSFQVRPVVNNVEIEPSETFTLPANAPVRNNFSSITLKPCPGYFRTTNGQSGDVDGDGEYELFFMREEFFNPGTTSEWAGDTSRLMLDCYKQNGQFLWRYEYGKNIKAEMQNNAPCYVVADFDGDGKAEVCVRSSELSVFQSGTPAQRIIGDYLKPDGITLYPYAPNYTSKTDMPEFLYMLKGDNGAPIDSIPYKPDITSQPYVFWGLNERPFYQYMSAAWLDGKLPSIVTLRGLGEGQPFKINSYDFRNGHFSLRPDSFSTVNTYNATLKSYTAFPNIAFGGHSIRIKDIDNDGKDEVLVTAAVFDHDLKLLYTQADKGLNHGDCYQILDMDPDRPGLEFFAIQQNNPNLVGAAIWEAETGYYLQKFFVNNVVDPSRGEGACILPDRRGAQCYGGTPGVMDYKGNYLGERTFVPCSTVYWDADFAKEILVNNYTKLDGALQKYDVQTGGVTDLVNFKAEGCASRSIQGTVMNCDLFGDWREEFILESADLKTLKIYSTSIPSKQRIYTLMHNPGYRTQTTCFGRIGGTYTDYYLGPQMTVFPPSPYVGEDIRWDENPTFVSGKKILFAADPTADNSPRKVTLSTDVAPSALYVCANGDYQFSGKGKLIGEMPLIKTGKGKLTLDSVALFSGALSVYDGNVCLKGRVFAPVTVSGSVWSGVATRGKSGSVLTGNATLEAGLQLMDKGAISPGTEAGVIDSLVVNGNAEFQKRSYAVFDLSSKASGVADRLIVRGKLLLNDTITFCLNPLGEIPSGAEFPLIRCTSMQRSANAKVLIAGMPGRICEVYYKDNEVGVRFPATRKNAALSWAGLSSLWDANSSRNWMNQAVYDVFIPGDSVSFDNGGLAKAAVWIDSELQMSDWVINTAGNYLFAGNGTIGGVGGITKTGTGKLTLFTNNTFTGRTLLTGGITEVNSINDKGLAGALGASSAPVQINGSTLMLSQKTVHSDRNFEIGSAGATIHVSDTRFQCTLSGTLSGAGALTKVGPGNLILGGANTFSGGLVVNEGSVILANKTANMSGPGAGLITLNGGTLLMSDVQQSEVATWSLAVPDGKTAYFAPDGRCSLTGKLTGGGTLYLQIPYIRTEFRGDWSQFTGTINIPYNAASEAHFRINNTYGYPQASFVLNRNTSMYRTLSGSVSVGSVASADTTAELATTDGSGRTTQWQIGANNKDAAFAGLITGPGSVTKIGSASWSLSNHNTYTGGTIVQAGKLIVANSTGSATGTGTVQVAASATLCGSGIIGGKVQMGLGGTLTPGALTPGTITLKSDLTLASGSHLAFRIWPGRMDKLIVEGKVTLGGILDIQRIGVNVKAGDTFTLIQSPSISGQFEAITPEVPAAGLKWNLTRISEGIIGIDIDSQVKELPEDQLRIYPTLISTVCHVQFTGYVGRATLEVKDLNGQTLQREQLSSENGEYLLRTDRLPAGTYLLHLQCGDHLYYKKVVKR